MGLCLNPEESTDRFLPHLARLSNGDLDEGWCFVKLDGCSACRIVAWELGRGSCPISKRRDKIEGGAVVYRVHRGSGNLFIEHRNEKYLRKKLHRCSPTHCIRPMAYISSLRQSSSLSPKSATYSIQISKRGSGCLCQLKRRGALLSRGGKNRNR